MPSINSQPVIIPFSSNPRTASVWHGIDGVEGFLTFTHIDRKANPVGRLNDVVFVVYQDDLIAWRRIGEADTARGRAIGNFPHGALRSELCIRQGEKMGELSGVEAANAEGHSALHCTWVNNGDVRHR